MLKQNIELIKFYLSVLKEDSRGLTTVEYAVAGALVAAAVVTAFQTLGTDVGNSIGDLSDAITGGGTP